MAGVFMTIACGKTDLAIRLTPTQAREPLADAF